MKTSGTADFQAKVKAISPDDLSGTYDLVLLLTKQPYNESVLQDLLSY